ncbi:MAG: hypothetical protein R2699_04790 [Acidimicrobiales bacterium]
MAGEARTVVLLEAPHRLGGTLEDLAAACGGDRRVAVARELTKLHEEIWRGPWPMPPHGRRQQRRAASS